MYTLNASAVAEASLLLYHAPIAMLHHWDLIGTVDPPGEFDIASILLICTSLDSYHQALALLKELC